MIRYTLQSTIIMLAVMTVGFLSVEGVASASDSPLITTESLEKQLGEGNLLIIDVRVPSNYGVGHIPGSINIPYEEWDPYCDEDECLLVPEDEDLVALLREKGVNNDSRVVIYDHGNTLSDATKGGSVTWVLKSRGHKNVNYLNGGFTKWTFEGRIIDNKVPEMETGNFSVRPSDAKVIGFEELQKAMKGDALLVDARSSEQHFGASKRADVSQSGHIPGSLSLPSTFLNNAGPNRAPATIKEKDVLAQVAKGAGLPADKDQELIVYCNTGQWAGMECLILKDILGYRNVSLYDGSVLEYAWKSFEPLVQYTWGHVKQ